MSDAPPRPKVFVLGPSASGKTPFARALCDALKLPHVPASAWVRERFPGGDFATRADFVDAITRFSIAQLRDDPARCTDYLFAHYDLSRPCVIEGMRNPHDFVRCFDARCDIAVLLSHEGTALTPTAFERGLDVIAQYLDWLSAAGVMPERAAPQCVRYRFRHFRRAEALTDTLTDAMPSLDHAIEDFVARYGPLVTALSEPPAPTPSFVHAEIPPLKTHVRKEFLFGMDPAHVGQYVPCAAFAVSSYAGSAPTFKILLSDGAVFSYVPPSALCDVEHRDPSRELSLDELVYLNCPAGAFCVHRFEALVGECLAYFKARDVWMNARYLFTIDWYTGNDLLHAVALDNGQYAMLPHHKLKFGAHAAGFEPYRKMRRTWAVSG